MREIERERERESGGNMNCLLVKVQGLRKSDIMWGAEFCGSRTVDVLVSWFAGIKYVRVGQRM